ncbi:MAG: hypothetical protein ACUVRM_01315 [Bacillota bacterium]
MVWRRLTVTFTLAFLFVLGVTSAALAADLGPGARAMGMAGAYVAVADDGTAAYWNPAGIAQLKIFSITPSIGAAGDFSLLQSIIEGEEVPVGNTELAVNGMFGLLFRSFGISVLADLNITTQTEQNEQGEILNSQGEVEALATGMITLAHRFGNVFAVGVNLKGFYGQGGSFDYSTSSNSYTETESLGTGYGLDVGALFKVGQLLRVGVNLENIYANINWEKTYSTYTYEGEQETVTTTTATTTEELPAVAHVGLAVKPPVLGILIAAQADMPLGGGGVTTYRIGLEQGLLFLKLRAGAVLDTDFAVANYTAGLGFKLGPVVLDVAAVADPALALEAAVLTAGFTF